MKRIIEKKIKVKDLKFNFENPRKITKKEREKLKKSLLELGDFGIFVVDEEYNVISGTQRAKILLEIDENIEILVKQLEGYSEKEKRIINIKANELSGEWDNDKLNTFLSDLKEVDYINLLSKINDEVYTQKIDTPFYEPTGKNVNVSDLYDLKDYYQKIKIIEEKKDILDENLYEFLLFSATRFIRINFKNVAEFYSNLKDEKIKKLFEDLILVIIDYDNAIEKGYIEYNEFIDSVIRNENEQI